MHPGRALRRVLMAAVTVFITLSVFAQGKDITIYTMQLKPTFTKYMEELFAKYEQQHPGVKVKWLDFPFADYETKLLTLIQSGKAPDVQNLPFEYMVRLQQRNLLLNLDQHVSKEVQAGYLDSILETGCKVNGSLYAVPWYQATNVLMYNKDIMKAAGLDPEKPPTSNEEMFAMSRQIKSKTDKFGTMFNYTEEGGLKLLFAAEGIPLIDSSGKKATFNTPEALKLVLEHKKLFDEKVIPRDSIIAEHRRSVEMYKGGKMAFFISGPQFIHILKNESPTIYNATGIGPAFPIKGTNKYDCATQNLGVYAKTPNPKEAVELALFVTNAENQLAFSRLVTIFPSSKEALKDPFFTKPGDSPEDKARNIAAKQLETATIIAPPLRNLSELNKVMNETIQKVLLRNVPAQDALNEAEKKWNEILGK